MAVTVSSLMTTVDACEAITDWVAHNISGSMGALSAIDATDEEMPPKEGTYCLTWDIDIEIGGYCHTIASVDYSAKLVYIWASAFTAASLEVSAPGGGAQSGVYIIARDSAGNFGYWHVGGSDTYKGGWRCFVADLSQAPDTNNGSAPDLSDCTGLGLGFSHKAKSKATHNVFIDFLRVTDKGSGIKVITTSASVATWEDVFTGDDGISAGVIRQEAGVYFVQGPIQFGDDSAGDMEFLDTGAIVVFEDASVSAGHYALTVVGSSGATIKFQMGNKSGDRGIQGCVISGTLPFDITATDTDIDEFKLYGCAISNANIISLPPAAAGREVIDCTFEACGEMLADTCVVQYCTFINPDDEAIRMSTILHNITDCTFINCPHGVNITESGSSNYEFNNLVFSGCTVDIGNSSGGAVVVEAIGTSDPQTSDGDPVTIINAKVLEINNVKTEAVEITHGAIAGGDNAFLVGYYLRGLTSGAIGYIIEAVDGTHTIVRVQSGTFSDAENVNETTDGTAGGDTGDAAATSAVDDEYVQCIIIAAAGGVEAVGTVLMDEEATTSYGAAGYYKATENYNYTGDQPVIVRARYQSWKSFLGSGTIGVGGLTISAVWLTDPNYGLV